MAKEFTLKRLFKYLFLFIALKFSYLESVVTKSHPLQLNLTDVQIYHVIDNALWGEVDGSALQVLFSPLFDRLLVLVSFKIYLSRFTFPRVYSLVRSTTCDVNC